jgi:hypothetical protein
MSWISDNHLLMHKIMTYFQNNKDNLELVDFLSTAKRLERLQKVLNFNPKNIYLTESLKSLWKTVVENNRDIAEQEYVEISDVTAVEEFVTEPKVTEVTEYEDSKEGYCAHKQESPPSYNYQLINCPPYIDTSPRTSDMFPIHQSLF